MRREEKERVKKEREAAGASGRKPGEEQGVRRQAGTDRREEEGYSHPESSAQKKPRE